MGPAAEEAGLTAAGVEAAAERERASRTREPAVVGGAAAAGPERRWPRRAAKVLAVVVVTVGLAALAVWGARQVYFLGPTRAAVWLSTAASRTSFPSAFTCTRIFLAPFVGWSCYRVYGEAFTRRIRAMGIRDRPTAPRSPWQNGHAED